MQNLLIQKINQSDWWHVPPSDPGAYNKRGKFLASTYRQAELFGKPNLEPVKVEIRNPIWGFSEIELLKQLFKSNGTNMLKNINVDDKDFYQKRLALDANMHKKAKLLGYDSIVLMTKQGKIALQKGQKPKSIELNLIQ